MLDLGEADFAKKIAMTALNLWKTEVGRGYNCYEHFLVESGRGAGWHQFGALSSPVVNWYAAYYRPGELTAGFDVWIGSIVVAEDARGIDAELRIDDASPGRKLAVIACLEPGPTYRATWNDREVACMAGEPGQLTIILPGDQPAGRLRISVK